MPHSGSFLSPTVKDAVVTSPSRHNTESKNTTDMAPKSGGGSSPVVTTAAATTRRRSSLERRTGEGGNEIQYVEIKGLADIDRHSNNNTSNNNSNIGNVNSSSNKKNPKKKSKKREGGNGKSTGGGRKYHLLSTRRYFGVGVGGNSNSSSSNNKVKNPGKNTTTSNNNNNSKNYYRGWASRSSKFRISSSRTTATDFDDSCCCCDCEYDDSHCSSSVVDTQQKSKDGKETGREDDSFDEFLMNNSTTAATCASSSAAAAAAPPPPPPRPLTGEERVDDDCSSSEGDRDCISKEPTERASENFLVVKDEDEGSLALPQQIPQQEQHHQKQQEQQQDSPLPPIDVAINDTTCQVPLTTEEETTCLDACVSEDFSIDTFNGEKALVVTDGSRTHEEPVIDDDCQQDEQEPNEAATLVDQCHGDDDHEDDVVKEGEDNDENKEKKDIIIVGTIPEKEEENIVTTGTIPQEDDLNGDIEEVVKEEEEEKVVQRTRVSPMESNDNDDSNERYCDDDDDDDDNNNAIQRARALYNKSLGLGLEDEEPLRGLEMALSIQRKVLARGRVCSTSDDVFPPMEIVEDEIIRTLEAMAVVFTGQGELHGALGCYDDVVDILKTRASRSEKSHHVGGKHHDDEEKKEVNCVESTLVGDCNEELAGALYNMSQIQLSLAEYQQAMGSIQRGLKALKLNPENVIDGRSGLRKNSSFLLCNPALDDGTENRIRSLSPTAQILRLRLLLSMAQTQSTLQDVPSGIRTYRHILSHQRAMLGPVHPEVARTLFTLGTLLSRCGRYRIAARYYEEELRIKRVALGEDSPEVARVLHALGRLYDEKLGDFGTALSLYEEALKIETRAMERSGRVVSDDPNLGPCGGGGGRCRGISRCRNHQILHRERVAQVRETKRKMGRIHYKTGHFNLAMGTLPR